jgi:F420H(2)-dependent quinone reductase
VGAVVYHTLVSLCYLVPFGADARAIRSRYRPHSVPPGHQPFAVANRTVNPLLGLVLCSPLHRVVSGRLALVTVTGRRTGREYTFPVAYRRAGAVVRIPVGWPARKLWWRNLRDGGPVRLRLQGRDYSGQATARGDERSGVTVEVALDGAGAA